MCMRQCCNITYTYVAFEYIPLPPCSHYPRVFTTQSYCISQELDSASTEPSAQTLDYLGANTKVLEL